MLLIGRGFITIPSFCLARNEGGGGIAFVERENVKNIQKTKQNLLLFGGVGGI